MGRARWPIAAFAAAAALGLVTAGCSTPGTPGDPPASTGDRAAGTTSPVPTTVPTTLPTPVPTPVAIPGTPVGRQVAWVLRQFTRADETGPPASSHFTPAFLAEVNEPQILSMFMQLRSGGPYRPTAYRGDATSARVTLVDAAGRELALTAEVDRSGRLSTLFVRPQTTVGPLSDWSAFDKALSDLGADVSALAADVTQGRCLPRHAVEAERTMPTGSAFKLYVLGAVADRVAAGTLRWDQPLTVTDRVRSLPSGRLQDAPTGTRVTVREAALGMISISDNTATDLLMGAVGRAAVEAQQKVMGHQDPSLNAPFPTTRELFQLAWGTPNRRPAWTAADESGRRTLLASLPTGRLRIPETAMTTPGWPDHLEWFASPADLCAAHARLQQVARAAATAPVRTVLSANPGVTMPKQVTYAAFKGGSSPGVLTLTWYVESPTGPRVLVVMVRSLDPDKVADTERIAGIAQRGLELLVS